VVRTKYSINIFGQNQQFQRSLYLSDVIRNFVFEDRVKDKDMKAIPKGSRKTQCVWWSPEVEDAVILRWQTQKALKADPNDDAKVTAYQKAVTTAQTTTNDAKTKLWRKFISDSHCDLKPAEVWAVKQLTNKIS